jgi:hypothetical protein
MKAATMFLDPKDGLPVEQADPAKGIAKRELLVEIPSIQVEGETWRRLKVTFPDSAKSHTKEQISCFGPDAVISRSRPHP